MNATGRSGARGAGARAARLALMAAAAFALVLSLGGTTASTEGTIVVRGAASGTHLRLSLRGGDLVAEGSMQGATPTGCHFTSGERVAVCPMAGAGAIEVETGPSDDKVEVLEQLPLPLTAYLGQGEDKLIGNGEPDTCYPQGTKRNRCIGGAGDDVCITGPRNSDCVGGPGNDYCKHSTGSDGCWGGPGNDVCVMGPGMDGCHGEGGNDRLYGGPDPDQLYGGRGYDYCNGGRGIGKSHGCEAGPRH
jgi:Ca2+-binding RTX toxin-like protein